MKLAVRNGKELRYVEATDIKFGEKTVAELFGEVKKLQDCVSELITIIEQHHLIKAQAEYVVKIGEKLERVQKLELAEYPKSPINLSLCKVEDGKLIVDNKKVGGSL